MDFSHSLRTRFGVRVRIGVRVRVRVHNYWTSLCFFNTTITPNPNPNLLGLGYAASLMFLKRGLVSKAILSESPIKDTNSSACRDKIYSDWSSSILEEALVRNMLTPEVLT
jgi:hypothetical protein